MSLKGSMKRNEVRGRKLMLKKRLGAQTEATCTVRFIKTLRGFSSSTVSWPGEGPPRLGDLVIYPVSLCVEGIFPSSFSKTKIGRSKTPKPTAHISKERRETEKFTRLSGGQERERKTKIWR